MGLNPTVLYDNRDGKLGRVNVRTIAILTDSFSLIPTRSSADSSLEEWVSLACAICLF